MQTAYDLVWMAAERTPDQLAIVDDVTPRRLTYCELIAEVDAVAAGLHELGVRAGTRIATVLPNYFEHCIVLLALQRLAAVPALMNFRLHPDQLAGMMRLASVQGAVIQNDVGLAPKLANAVPPGGILLSVGGAAAPARDFSVCRGDSGLLPPRPRPRREDLSFIFYTSGTTGKPKAAMVSHGADEHRIVYMSPMFGVRQGSHLRALGTSPLFHAIGFYGLFLTTLTFNGTYYVMSVFDRSAAISSIETNEISFLFVVPTILQAIVSAPDYRPERMSSVKLVLFGGAPIMPALLHRIDAEWPARLYHAYGSTEAMTPLYMPDPAGRPKTLRPGYSARVRVIRFGGGPGDIAAPGEAGELIVDADRDSLFSGYLDMPQETAAKVRNGWYFTGDVCIPHGNGELDLVGRVDDMIRSGGESVYPEEIEAVLAAHPAVKEACVVGIPDELWGELVTACVVLEYPAADCRELDMHCLASALAKYKRPRAYLFADALPRNASNKILRRVLREEVIAKCTDDKAAHLHMVGA
jgi:2-furoate---CoA ligase